MNIRKPTEKELAAFTSKIKKLGTEPEDCWEWQGSLDNKGYGRFNLVDLTIPPGSRNRFKTYKAHRLVLEWLSGVKVLEYAEDSVVMHLCNNKRCVNPSHLRLGTHSENIAHIRETQEALGLKPALKIVPTAKSQFSLKHGRDYVDYTIAELLNMRSRIDAELRNRKELLELQATQINEILSQ